MKPKILLLEDDNSVRSSLVKVLEMENYGVLQAKNASQAIELFQSSTVDIVVLDVGLEGQNGWCVFERMKELNPFVPAVVITAEFDQREKAVAAGAEALMEKPMDVPAFLGIVRDLLDETSEKRLERVCGNDEYCRFVAGYYAPYLHRLDERHSQPRTSCSSLRSAPRGQRIRKEHGELSLAPGE